MNIQVLDSYCAQDTFALGSRMGASCHAGDVICLDGELGAGKTVFAQGFGSGLGIRERITSSTFTLMQVYEEGRLFLYHFDVYRVESAGQMDDIDFEEYLYGDGVCLIEWGNRLREILPADAVSVLFDTDVTKGKDYRKITLKGWRHDIIGD